MINKEREGDMISCDRTTLTSWQNRLVTSNCLGNPQQCSRQGNRVVVHRHWWSTENSKPQCHRFLSCCYGQWPLIDVNCALHAATLQLHAYKSLIISTAVSSNLQLHTCKASSSLQLLCIGIFMQNVCTNCNHKQVFNSDQVVDISYVLDAMSFTRPPPTLAPQETHNGVRGPKYRVRYSLVPRR